MRFLDYLFRAFILAPLAGGHIGCILCLISMSLLNAYPPLFALIHGLLFGMATGLVFGVIAAGFTLKFPIWTAAKYLGGGTLLLGLLGVFVPPLAWILGSCGFWLGFGLLLTVGVEQNQANPTCPPPSE